MQIVRMKQACEQLGICRSTMYAMIERGEIKKHVIGQRCVGFKPEDLDNLINRSVVSDVGTKSDNDN